MYLSDMRNVFVEMQEMLVGAKSLHREEDARAAVALGPCSHLHLLFYSIVKNGRFALLFSCHPSAQ